MVEGGGLENRCTGNRTGGSNPSLSANSHWVVPGDIGKTPHTGDMGDTFPLRRGRLRDEKDGHTRQAPKSREPKWFRAKPACTLSLRESRPKTPTLSANSWRASFLCNFCDLVAVEATGTDIGFAKSLLEDALFHGQPS